MVGVWSAASLRNVELVVTAIFIGKNEAIELIDDDTPCCRRDLVEGAFSTEVICALTATIVAVGGSREGANGRKANDGCEKGGSKCEHR